MSIPERLLRIAQRRVRERLGLVQGAGFRRDPAREELEAFLREAEPHPGPPPGACPPGPQPAPAPPPHPYAREYRLLGAPVGSDLATVQQCWRRLVRETHPDRFQHDPEAQRAAGERLRRASAAYDRLKSYLAE